MFPILDPTTELSCGSSLMTKVCRYNIECNKRRQWKSGIEVRGSARCAESVAAEGKWRPLNGGGAPSWGQPVVSDLGSSLRSHSTVHRALTTFSFPLKKYPHINNISHTINVSRAFMAVRNTSGSSDYSVSTVTLRQSGSAGFTMTLDAKARALMKGKGWTLNQTNKCAVVSITATSSTSQLIRAFQLWNFQGVFSW